MPSVGTAQEIKRYLPQYVLWETVNVRKNPYLKSTSLSKGIILINTNYSSGLSSAATEQGRCTVAELRPDQQVSIKKCQLDTKFPPGWDSGVGPTSSSIMSQTTSVHIYIYIY